MGRGSDLFAAAGAPRVGSAFGGAGPTSLLVHAAAFALLLFLAPRFTRAPAEPATRSGLGVLFYDPPPAPAAPLPVGDGPVSRTAVRPRVVPDPDPVPVTTVVVETPVEPMTSIEAPEAPAGGSPDGSASGTALGETYGRDGGIAGGRRDGLDGGVEGGTGRFPVPVRNYDHGPVRVHMVEPAYPPDAFAKKIEGVVEVELLIDVDGRVVRARVLQGVRPLDAAALDAVRQWLFRPALKDGRPVPTLATAPVRFRIY